MKRRLPTLILLIVILGAAVSIQNGETLLNAALQLEDFLRILFPKLLVILIFLLIAQIVIEVAAPFIEKTSRLEFLGDRQLFVSFFSYMAYAAAFIIGAFVVSDNIPAIITSLGLVGLGLAYALQHPIQNIAGWLAIVFVRPYKTRDRISVGAFFGDVETITMMYTRLREFGASGDSPSGRIVNMPNSKVLFEPTVNFTYDVPFVWDEVAVPLTLDSDTKKVHRTLEKVVGEAIGTEHRGAYEAYYPILAGTPSASFLTEKPLLFFEFGPGCITARIRYLVDVRGRLAARTALTKAILDRAGRKDLSIALPQMKIFVEG